FLLAEANITWGKPYGRNSPSVHPLLNCSRRDAEQVSYRSLVQQHAVQRRCVPVRQRIFDSPFGQSNLRLGKCSCRRFRSLRRICTSPVCLPTHKVLSTLVKSLPAVSSVKIRRPRACFGRRQPLL